MAKRTVKPIPEPEVPGGRTFTIPQAASESGFTEAYIRTLIRQKRLKSYKVPLGPESAQYRHMVHEEDLKEFLFSSGRRKKRDDGRTKFVFYATVKEYQTIQKMFMDAGLEELWSLVRTANPLKPGKLP